jgi:hypothetical protein
MADTSVEDPDTGLEMKHMGKILTEVTDGEVMRLQLGYLVRLTDGSSEFIIPLSLMTHSEFEVIGNLYEIFKRPALVEQWKLSLIKRKKTAEVSRLLNIGHNTLNPWKRRYKANPLCARLNLPQVDSGQIHP